jgi:polyribonucleotide nucleotidyltransferase
MDKIGEVIGPKGKVINTIQQETGADIAVDDDGQVGTVTIGSKDGEAVREAQRRIELILDPPMAEVGAVYAGRVVNITKFGAFVNILPGRDGLIHISKLGQGKRIDKVEDVVDLGDEIQVRVDDIDPQGKVSLSLAGEPPAGGGGGESRPARAAASDAGDDEAGESGGVTTKTASFEEFFEEEVASEFGDLGPAEQGGGAGFGGAPRRSGGGGGPRRGGNSSGGDRGGRGRGPRR